MKEKNIEKSVIYETHNETQFMKGILIRRILDNNNPYNV